jgi:hypothetical protein
LKTKRTRPYFKDAQLIWEKISDEPGVHYLVTLTRGGDSSNPYYEWTDIVRLDDDNRESALRNALAAESEGGSGAPDDPTFEGGEMEGSVAIAREPDPSLPDVSHADD